jgi:hypothetical protein
MRSYERWMQEQAAITPAAVVRRSQIADAAAAAALRLRVLRHG